MPPRSVFINYENRHGDASARPGYHCVHGVPRHRVRATSRAESPRLHVRPPVRAKPKQPDQSLGDIPALSHPHSARALHRPSLRALPRLRLPPPYPRPSRKPRHQVRGTARKVAGSASQDSTASASRQIRRTCTMPHHRRSEPVARFRTYYRVNRASAAGWLTRSGRWQGWSYGRGGAA